MATHTHITPLPPTSGAPERAGADRPECGCGSSILGFFRRCIIGVTSRLFGRKLKARRTPIVQEDVTLTQEGCRVWEKVTDPESPVGKPVNHRRRRLADGGPSS